MPVPSHPSDLKLDNLLRAALTTGAQRHTVWAMLHDEIGADGVTRNAEPIRVIVEIVADAGGALVWHPVSGVTLDGQEVDLEVLQSDRVWWCSWSRRFAASSLRVELEQCQEPAQSAADQALEGLEAWEQALAKTTAKALGVPMPRERQVLRERYGLDGDREFRVLAEFPAPRGYGEA